jgi:hypothetical protein
MKAKPPWTKEDERKIDERIAAIEKFERAIRRATLEGQATPPSSPREESHGTH